MAYFAGFGNSTGAIHLEDLLQERPVEKIIELAAGGEGTNFEATMAFAGYASRTKILGWAAHAGQNRHSWIEPVLQILEQLGLVAFHRPDVVATCLANLDRYLALGMQRISDHHFIAEIDIAQ